MDLPLAALRGSNHAGKYDALSRHLFAHSTASEALAAWCEERGIGEGPIRTEVVDRATSFRGERAVGYRRVRLLRGRALLSTAEIRYRRATLSPAMMRALDETATPFGVVVAPLGPRRITTLARAGDQHLGKSVLIHHATVLDRCDRPIARVREAYQRILIG